MKRFIAYILLILMLPVTASADWYGNTWHPSDYWAYITPERYQGEEYTASLEDMAGMHEACPPARLTISAGLCDADRLLHEAMRYAPGTVVISLPTRGDAIRYCERWTDPEDIDPIISAVWTRTSDLFHVRREGKDVIITIPRYSDGWLAFVDTSEQIRCYQDTEYSNRLLECRREAETITGTETERLYGACKLVTDRADFDREEMRHLLANGFRVRNRDSHCVAGMINGLAVCDGLVAGLTFALACLGIDSVDVNGIGEMDNHSWLRARIDGAWINVDPTWAEANHMECIGIPDEWYAEYSTLNTTKRYTT